MRAIVCFLAAVAAVAQPLSPDAEFDLNAKPHRFGRAMRSYFVATANGLTFVVVGDNNMLLVSADPDGCEEIRDRFASDRFRDPAVGLAGCF
jgi:hypothetical protein